jgi:DNA primase
VGILDEDIAAVRAASDIVGVITQYTPLKRVGRRWQGLCPFHAEKTPSFSVNAEEGLWFCFGCQARGDVITFVREIEHLDFAGAVEWLAGRAGYTLRYTDRQQGEGRKRRATLVDAMARAVDWYNERLLTADDAGTARSYLRSRGLTGDEVRAYRIGWAPDAWDELCAALKLPHDVLRDTGLGFVNRRNRLQDTFRARVLFPIFDAQGDPVAFGGRLLPGAEGAKYKNTPETPLYSKSKVLYGLNWVKSAIVSADTAVVCEGYTDVIGMARAGVPTAIATCGTALTDEHVRLLRRYARRFVLAFDADGAGLAAADRFYEWEKAHDLEVAVAALPAGVDPGDLAQRDPSALAAAVDGAIPFLRFRVDRVLGAGDLTTAEGRARTAEAALAVIAEHPSELVRDQYVLDVAARCRLDADKLRERLRAGPRPAHRIDDGARTAARRPHDSPELEVLRHAVHAPEAVARWLDESLFADEVHAAVYRALATAETVQDALAGADPEAADLLARLLVEDTDSDPLDAVFRLLTECARREVSALRAEAASAEDGTDVLQTQADLTRAMNALRVRDDAGVLAAEQLLAWLAQRGEEGAAAR